MSGREPVAEICERALIGERLGSSALERLLGASSSEAEAVFSAAREVRRRQWGDVVFLYGFVYFSTYCRNHCAFCLYRAGNAAAPRYRRPPGEIVEVARRLVASGVVLVDLTMGEGSPARDADGPTGLPELVAAVKDATDAAVMVSPGVLSGAALTALRETGADWYALYQETHTPELFARLRLDQSFSDRVEARRAAAEVGLLVEDGVLTGVGDSAADRARAIGAMRAAGCVQVRCMGFVPQVGTPLATVSPPPASDELLTIAVMRLAMPNSFIPASLDVEGLAGLERRLQAGANVVTSIVPPRSGLAGVSHASLGIDDGARTVARVLPCLARLGLRAGSAAEYWQRLEQWRARGAAGCRR